MEEIFKYGLQGVVAFGSVGFVSYLLKKYRKMTLKSEVKLALLGVIFFAVGYVPTDIGADLLNRIKLAVGAAISLHAVHSVLMKFAPEK